GDCPIRRRNWIGVTPDVDPAQDDAISGLRGADESRDVCRPGFVFGVGPNGSESCIETMALAPPMAADDEETRVIMAYGTRDRHHGMVHVQVAQRMGFSAFSVDLPYCRLRATEDRRQAPAPNRGANAFGGW